MAKLVSAIYFFIKSKAQDTDARDGVGTTFPNTGLMASQSCEAS
jgi:hypothetical protein